VGGTDAEDVGGFSGMDLAVVKLLEDVLEEWGGEAFGQLLLCHF
jgi:hypothetical protein